MANRKTCWVCRGIAQMALVPGPDAPSALFISPKVLCPEHKRRLNRLRRQRAQAA